MVLHPSAFFILHSSFTLPSSQWDVFKEYERELEVHMDKVRKKEGRKEV